MEPVDLTISILREIRDEIRQTNQRLDQTNQRLDQTRDELSRHIVESEMRTTTAITSLAGALDDVKQFLVERREPNRRITECEGEFEQIKQHVGM